jgi:glycosyltransferase involved in cell wall biosynthesis
MTAFTVVMAAHDTEATIAPAIRSVLAQTRADFELVVVDDGSTDGTADRVREFLGDERVRLLQRPQSGAAAARSAGVEAGSAPFVSMIDSDDLWMPRYLEEMGAALEADLDAGFAYTDAWYLDERSRRVRRVSAMGYQRPPEPPPATAEELFAALLERNFIFNAVTLRRSAIEAAGLPDTRLRSMIDWEWWLRLAAAGHRAVRVRGRLAIYRLRASSISRDPGKVVTGQRDLWRIVADEYDLPEARRAELRARSEAGAGPSRLHRRVAALKKALLYRRDYFREPPPEVRDAFDDLRTV